MNLHKLALALGLAASVASVSFMAHEASAQTYANGGAPQTDNDTTVFPYALGTYTSYPQGHAYVTGGTLGMSATGQSGYVQIVDGPVEVQLDGTATSVSGQLQRSAVNPASGSAVWAPVGSAQSSVNPSTGVAPITATESGIGWYRYNVTALSGGNLNVTLSGRAH